MDAESRRLYDSCNRIFAGTSREYVRFFCGLLLTVLLAQPVLDLMGEAGQVTELYRTAEYEQMIKEMEYAADLLEKGGE